MMPAISPASTASAPRPGPTVRSSSMSRFAGSAPARSRTARSLADCVVKLPEIWAEPPRIGSLMLGAERTWSSRTMAKGLLTFAWVTAPKRWPPCESKRMFTTGMLPFGEKPGWASVRLLPDTITCR